ncbi:TetR/AcrR family transcriptional regulator [Mucilaginibacter pallidiroseus]|uniref:TetR/AcrR family transcriptional regulator n=1 Tax=Mucilaginibacter pallidiroseus TaxID=2599295 RepID=A0A563UCV5_9SPHI|nr:TetR/AcrR family transcriptional regulator [Mucilaginibacter pallidiroseus]TWR29202.1 TetR/AcrR family transcriptional regulator [Mucilaginibacter pallidiroseus]
MKKAERTRQFIIEQSAPLFNTKGVAGTAMSDVMEATKMAKGGLYGHFESKDELSYSVVDYCLTKFSDCLNASLCRQKTAKEKLVAYIDFFKDPQNPLIDGGCPMMNFGMEADDTMPAIKVRVRKGIDCAIDFITGIINDGIKAGEFIGDWNANEFALKVFAMLEGGTLIARVKGNNQQMAIIVEMLKTEIEQHTKK